MLTKEKSLNLLITKSTTYNNLSSCFMLLKWNMVSQKSWTIAPPSFGRGCAVWTTNTICVDALQLDLGEEHSALILKQEYKFDDSQW